MGWVTKNFENNFFTCKCIYNEIPDTKIHHQMCTMKCDIGPFKKGQSVFCIEREIGSSLFIFQNIFNKYQYSCDIIKMQSSARKIQRVWRRCISDPEYTVCKNRLQNEFSLIKQTL